MTNQNKYSCERIGAVQTCYPEKFGIPKQPGLVTAATGVLVPDYPYNREEMWRGIEDFSHLWIVFLFHDTLSEGWKPTVRPPRLGGQKRVGVFASRSPHRPNHLGMSVVRLEKKVIEKGSVKLELSGVDFLDGTPVVDVKPYIPYSDIVEDAGCGYTEQEMEEIEADFTFQAESFCQKYEENFGRSLAQLILQTLRYDPRPASQRKVGREFGVQLWDVNVRWRVTETGFLVLSCSMVVMD